MYRLLRYSFGMRSRRAKFFKKISTHPLTVLTISVITRIEQRKQIKLQRWSKRTVDRLKEPSARLTGCRFQNKRR